MTNKELHKILDDKNKKITLKEYQEILYEMKIDVLNEQRKCVNVLMYVGEANGFQLALDLSEHISMIEKRD